MELKGKKVLVFGAGKSGIGAADLLNAVGACPVLYDGAAPAPCQDPGFLPQHHWQPSIYPNPDKYLRSETPAVRSDGFQRDRQDPEVSDPHLQS